MGQKRTKQVCAKDVGSTPTTGQVEAVGVALFGANPRASSSVGDQRSIAPL
jgi:hypothetical protein